MEDVNHFSSPVYYSQSIRCVLIKAQATIFNIDAILKIFKIPLLLFKKGNIPQLFTHVTSRLYTTA
jgi:hypothetical protein